MTNKEYLLEGHYFFQGQRGTQKGELTHFPDGKIIGLVGDDNQARQVPGTQKLLLGYIEGSKIYFAKVTPGLRRATDIRPVLWSVRKISDFHGLQGDYRGSYLMGGYMTPCHELEIRMNARGILTPEQLVDLRVEEIESQFDFHLNEAQFERAQESPFNQIGNISLTRKI